MTLSPLGDSALVLSLGPEVEATTLDRVSAIATEIARRRLPGVVDVLPAFASVTVFYDVTRIGSYEALAASLRAVVADFDSVSGTASDGVGGRLIEIPVCYGGEYGPDIEEVAAHTGFAPAEVARRHAAAEYRVHAIGFVPGFAYLGGLPPELHTPRRKSPRPQVAAGAVGIGGAQTGVYPLATPGGWNLIGRTPLRLFAADRAEAALLRAGDRVKFTPVSAAAFDAAAAAATAYPPSGDRAGRPAAPPGMRVQQAGMLTTVQDLGRRDRRGEGVPIGGAADAFALRLANLLVGNPETAAALELTLLGPELVFERDVVVALTGAEFAGLRRDRAVRVGAGEVLKLGPASRGCRGYLAVSGGIDVPPVLGSRGTYLRARLGGWEGRALRAGDRLPLGDARRLVDEHWRIDERILPAYATTPTLRVVRGTQADEFPAGWAAAPGAEFKVSPQSDRMGVRLQGAPLARAASVELRSMPVVPGTVQVPPDGQPILLLADAQTLGGYPQLAHVISADLPLAAQLRPGDGVRFEEVTLAEAHRLTLARERALALLREGLAGKFA